ncbi:MAG: Transcriptional regulator containing N-terminal RHH domain [Candidatus Methanohalarchaeum thermophilum]|uniref:Transcriptional regulator containing N-terminal RHH domain n=1 Tax=Methanohalarchaeum thermophilum TaxID=1903181 RepID=A0A1Q6DXP2_METT1|nr:MAG: Transcriptional regulator containing N-terminal RHH domain [Candidatus Methanohalarchaeum thermophilum]
MWRILSKKDYFSSRIWVWVLPVDFVLREFKYFVNIYVYKIVMPQVQTRVSEEMLKLLDKWVEEGKFQSRSDAIRTIIARFEEREKTRKFYKMLKKRSREAEENFNDLVPLE